MVSIAKFLKRRGFPDIDITILRDAIRTELANAALLAPIPGPEITRLRYKPPGDVEHTTMDELTDRIREVVNEQKIPCDLFNSIVKQVSSSDESDKRQKVRRAAAAVDKAREKVRLSLEAQKLKATAEQSGSRSEQVGSWRHLVGVIWVCF